MPLPTISIENGWYYSPTDTLENLKVVDEKNLPPVPITLYRYIMITPVNFCVRYFLNFQAFVGTLLINQQVIPLIHENGVYQCDITDELRLGNNLVEVRIQDWQSLIHATWLAIPCDELKSI